MAASARRRNLVGAFALAVADRLRAEAEAVTGLSGESTAALAVIAQQPGGTVEALRQAIGRSQPATVRIVDRLAAKGLVERRPSGSGPGLALVVTEAGRDRAEQVLTARDAMLDALLSELDADAAGALEGTLERLLPQLAQLPAGLTVCRLCDKGSCRGRGDCPVADRLEQLGVEMRPPLTRSSKLREPP